ncbi:MAG TPA: mersacidin/lichenicidin family type 2 lantibiotic [candidate division WOR-3 bacterium]|uniref:Mersacidin/lichenicidin family type 2 lantibiotic n=1 Tax=candidate division WOR-3 bacterium TaxID=2052148 RepID=A0A9C9ELV4_UNCW3|nr:mersacidin/lichenicidin family type 2 lantibiotic [candidate division WOR-3 bacterium]
MSTEDIIRAWKDPEYRDKLYSKQQMDIPQNPAGTITEITDTALDSLANRTASLCTCIRSAASCLCCR